MNQFTSNVHSTTRTTNGAFAFASTGSALVDIFSTAASYRGNLDGLDNLFAAAMREDTDLAIRLALYVRDAREGMGERTVGRALIAKVATAAPALVDALLDKVVEVGRFDDLLMFFDMPEFAEKAVAFYSEKLFKDSNGLAAKWLPRKGKYFEAVRKYHGVSPKFLRKFIVGLSNTVEQKLCAKQLNEINYSHVPGQAMLKYRTAFHKKDGERFKQFIEALKAGKEGVKINAAVVTPLEVYRAAHDSLVAEEMWKALPNYTEGKKILPIVDTSSSMEVGIPGSKSSALEAAISIGYYIASKQEGAFKDIMLNFDTRPRLYKVPEQYNLSQAFMYVKGMAWGGSTDFEASLRLVAEHGFTNKVPAEDMPEVIVVLSDMQFNEADEAFRHKSMLEVANNIFSSYRYKTPAVVFWNLLSKTAMPAYSAQSGVTMVGGFSTNVLKSALSGASPYDCMVRALSKERYAL